MKVIFLDVDGVLNKRSDWEVISPELGPYRLNSVLVERVNKIIDDTGAVIVLSSTWRRQPYSLEFISSELPIWDITDVGGPTRGHEIQRWIDEHKPTNYVILDDDGDMLEHQRSHFVQTDPEHGLTETLAYRATYKLKKEYNE